MKLKDEVGKAFIDYDAPVDVDPLMLTIWVFYTFRRNFGWGGGGQWGIISFDCRITAI